MNMQANPKTIALGPGGPIIPALGVGAWSWGDSLFWSYGDDYGADHVQAAFRASLEAGVNFFDTAEIYGLGESERLLGRFMQETDHSVQVATKYLPLPWRIGPQAVANALTASLKRLQVANILLYQVHWPFDLLVGQKTLMNALAEEVKQGRIAAVGVSNYSAAQMRAAHQYLAEWGIPLAVNQVRYSLLARQIETNGVLQTARELGVAILAYCPLAQGLLSGKYNLKHYQRPTGARRIDPRFSKNGLVKIELVIKTLRQIGEKYERTCAQVALNWLIAQGGVAPIPGAKNAEQARQNAAALGWEMTAEEKEQLSLVTLAWR